LTDTGKSQMLYRGIIAYRSATTTAVAGVIPHKLSAHVPDEDGHKQVEADSASEIIALIDSALDKPR
jgi:hypothetical protein